MPPVVDKLTVLTPWGMAGAAINWGADATRQAKEAALGVVQDATAEAKGTFVQGLGEGIGRNLVMLGALVLAGLLVYRVVGRVAAKVVT